MDIFLIGPPACGKTTTAQTLIAQRFGVKSIYKVTPLQLLIINEEYLVPRVDVLRETIRAARVEAVLFDECLHSDELFAIAVQAVKEARAQTGRNIYAVYCRQSSNAIMDLPALVDAAVEIAPPVTNEFKTQLPKFDNPPAPPAHKFTYEDLQSLYRSVKSLNLNWAVIPLLKGLIGGRYAPLICNLHAQHYQELGEFMTKLLQSGPEAVRGPYEKSGEVPTYMVYLPTAPGFSPETFEFDKHLADGFTSARACCNSSFLQNGKMSLRAYETIRTRPATTQEVEDYITLKANSPYKPLTAAKNETDKNK